MRFSWEGLTVLGIDWFLYDGTWRGVLSCGGGGGGASLGLLLGLYFLTVDPVVEFFWLASPLYYFDGIPVFATIFFLLLLSFLLFLLSLSYLALFSFLFFLLSPPG